MFDRAKFFAGVRARPFANSLKQFQVDGLNALLDEAERRRMTDARPVAYILATSHHETAATLQPIREIGKGAGRAYGKPDPKTGKVYYGRGYVQLTWIANYRTMGDLLGVDLVNNPDLALDQKIAAQILFEGMIRGSFTGRKLGDYFTPTLTNWTGARRIINGTDRAAHIADLARAYHDALRAAGWTGAAAAEKPARPAPPAPAPSAPSPRPATPAPAPAQPRGGFWSRLAAALSRRLPR